MDNMTVNTNYVALQPPYKIIKHGKKIGVQIGTQRVIIAGGNPFRTETHDYPVVAADNRIAALKDNDYHLDGSSDGEVWDNVETKNVSVLCDVGACLEWQQFIEILWHDHARLGDSRQPINKVFIFNKIVSYIKSMMLPSPDLYTLHLHTETSAEGFPNVVRTERDDVFALNVEWADNEVDLENRLLADLREYLLILSPNRSTNFWHMHYETKEERLRPLVERLNANPKATCFQKQIMASFTVKAIPPYEEKEVTIEPQNTQMEESVIDKISANNIRYYYEGWRNGKHGSICQTNGIYRFVEMARGKSGGVDDVKRKEEDNPIVAIGIVAYWLQFNSRMDTVIKRLTKYNCEIPKDIREQFDNYTRIRFDQFREEHRDDPNTWDWDWEQVFYANVIIPHEIAFNKRTEALFDYISDSDIALVRSVMNSYIKYLKKICAEKGYQVNEKGSVFDGNKRPFREITWEDEKLCFRDAVLRVMEQKRGDGSYLFEKNTQWMAVYRFAVDIAIMYDVDDPNVPEDSATPQYKEFEDFAHELQFEVNPPIRIPFKKDYIKDMNKKNYVRYNTRYPWSQNGIADRRSFTLYTEMEDVYQALEEKFNNLVGQAERTID